MLREQRASLEAGKIRSLSAGLCGGYRYITVQEGMGASTDYYDASGVLAGTVGMSDADLHCGGFTISYGVAPRCTPEPTLKLTGTAD